MITVRSCHYCNNGASDDDEYFRLIIASRYDSSEHPEAKKIWQRIVKSSERSRSKPILNEFAATIRETDLYTPHGIYLGRGGKYDADLGRLARVTNRIVRGLFYHETKRRLPAEARVKTFSDLNFDVPELSDVFERWLGVLAIQTPHLIGNGVFEYRCRFFDENPDASLWFLSFYESVSFIGMTVSQNQASEKENLMTRDP